MKKRYFMLILLALAVIAPGISPAQDAPKLDIPKKEDLDKMIKDTVVLFGQSVKKKDFGPLYASISALWKAQTTAPELQKIFQLFLDKNLDPEPPAGVAPVISQKPFIDDEARLILKGYFPTKPYVIDYELKYIYEYPEWKLVAIKVDM